MVSSSASLRLSAVMLLTLTVWTEEILSISVPTGKETPITPAKVTPRPTYHPPSAPAPVREYTFDNPEPEPLNPAWVPIPVKYLNVLRANSVYYIPFRIPNPAAQQPNYYAVGLKEQYTQQTTEATTYQQPTAQVIQAQQPTVYQAQQPTVYQTQQPTVYQTQQPTAYQTQQPTAYQTQQPIVQQTQQPIVQQQDATTAPKQSYNGNSLNAIQKEQEFGAKINPKLKYKPHYFLPKSQYGKQATKSGYPKKAVSAPSQKYYYYYPNAQ